MLNGQWNSFKSQRRNKATSVKDRGTYMLKVSGGITSVKRAVLEKMCQEENTNMVNNKKVGRLLNFTFYMSKKGAPQTALSKDPSLLKDQGDMRSPPEPQISKQGFPDRVYLLASVIFQNNHLEKPAAQRLINYGKDGGLPLPEVRDEEMQRAAYELAFSTLKYQELLEEVMIDSRFHLTQPVPADQMSIVAVMLYDFQDRKFPKRERQRKGEIIQEVRNVENLLLRFKTKLAAAFAGCKIKHSHFFIENFLPESVQKKQKMSVKLPLYAWVNTLKCSLDEVQSVLRDAGFLRVKSIKQLEGQTFFQDPHCGDTLVFPAQLKAQLYSTKLLCDHKLILQDKSCSLGPNAACSLLPEDGDVLMVGCFSGLTVSHMASLIAQKHKANNQPVVYVCVNDCTDAQKEKLQHTVSIMGCKNVKLMQKDFQSLDRGDKRLRKVRLILLIPRCSVSAVSNPVEFILQENGDTDLLQDLSHGSIAQSKLESLVAQQRKDIDHALEFPMNLAVVYSTCSSYPEENVDVVNMALQKAKDRSDQERQLKPANFRPSPSPFSSPDHGDATEDMEPFFVLEPTEHSNGCFLAFLNRQPDPVIQEAPQDVIARANATGILAGIGANQKKHHRSSNMMKKTAQAHCSQLHIPVCMQSRNQQIMSSNGRHDIHQPSKGKPRPLCLQTVSSSFSYAERKRTASSSFKTKKITPTKLTSTTVNAKTSASSDLNCAAVPPRPAAPVIHPRRGQAEVQKPMVLVLPIINFPGSFMPQHNPVGFSSSPVHNRWKKTAQFLSQRTSKSPVEELQPLFGPFKH